MTTLACPRCWRSAKDRAPGTWGEALRFDWSHTPGTAEQGLSGVPTHPTPFQAVTGGFSAQTEETR